MSLKRLEGQMAWISGGASGMGEAIAKLFALACFRHFTITNIL